MRALRRVAVAASLAALDGCAGLPRVGDAARQAAREPLTWAPAAAALLLVATDADRPLSEWARRETPLFGSTEGARRASDQLRSVAVGGWVAATLAAPAPAGEAFSTKLHDLALGYGALFATGLATDAAKRSTGRKRPDGSDALSFPSGHASRAATAATLGMAQARRALAPGTARRAVDAAFMTSAFGTGWARVEAGKHYPSDALVGFALGRFVGRAAELAWSRDDAPVALAVGPAGLWLAVGF